MSNSDPLTHFDLHINLIPPEGGDPQDILLAVYDGYEQTVFEGAGGASLRLPAGLYTVRWSYAGSMSEQVLRLPQTNRLDVPIRRSTPAPVPGAVDTHEYYSAYNSDTGGYSTHPGGLGSPADQDSYLYIMLRTHEAGQYRGEDLAAGLWLLDASLQPLFPLGERAMQTHMGLLWCALPAPAGFYFLEYRPPASASQAEPRLFPLHLFPGWQTRLFVFFERGAPNFASASLSILRNQPGAGSAPERFRADAAADLALLSLQNNQASLPKEIERGLLNGKFDNPLLGLLGAHFLLQRPAMFAASPSQQASWTGLAELTLANLIDLLPGSPDVLALRFKAALRFPQDERFPAPAAPAQIPPMLRAGLEALLQAESAGMLAAAEGGPTDQLAPGLYFDSPWATFQPPAAPAPENLELFLTKSPNRTADTAEAHWLVETVRQAVELSSPTGREPDWNSLAAGLGVAPRKLRRIAERMR